ncbi:MAG: CPBP family intramembrane metalloprotease, partial [Lachnospiraceae bacterium]|nr:CPBP family intramembrane metalloprotease [Lachnospiraceae bacterium]
MSSDLIKILDYVCIIGVFSLWYLYAFVFMQKEDDDKGKLYKLKSAFLRIHIPDIVCFIILGFIIQIAGSYLLTAVLTHLEKAEEYSAIISGMMTKNPYTVLYVCLLGPLCEELMFRGLIFSYLKKFLPFIIADIIQALAFGIYHRNIYQGIYAFIFGMLVGFINHIYGSLFPSVIIHLMINIAGLYAEMPLTDALGQNVMGILSLILVILGGAIVYFMVKKNKNRLKPHFMTCLMVFCAFFASAVSCRIVSVNAADQTGNHI